MPSSPTLPTSPSSPSSSSPITPPPPYSSPSSPHSTHPSPISPIPSILSSPQRRRRRPSARQISFAALEPKPREGFWKGILPRKQRPPTPRWPPAPSSNSNWKRNLSILVVFVGILGSLWLDYWIAGDGEGQGVRPVVCFMGGVAGDGSVCGVENWLGLGLRLRKCEVGRVESSGSGHGSGNGTGGEDPKGEGEDEGKDEDKDGDKEFEEALKKLEMKDKKGKDDGATEEEGGSEVERGLRFMEDIEGIVDLTNLLVAHYNSDSDLDFKMEPKSDRAEYWTTKKRAFVYDTQSLHLSLKQTLSHLLTQETALIDDSIDWLSEVSRSAGGKLTTTTSTCTSNSESSNENANNENQSPNPNLDQNPLNPGEFETPICSTSTHPQQNATQPSNPIQPLSFPPNDTTTLIKTTNRLLTVIRQLKESYHDFVFAQRDLDSYSEEDQEHHPQEESRQDNTSEQNSPEEKPQEKSPSEENPSEEYSSVERPKEENQPEESPQEDHPPEKHLQEESPSEENLLVPEANPQEENQPQEEHHPSEDHPGKGHPDDQDSPENRHREEQPSLEENPQEASSSSSSSPASPFPSPSSSPLSANPETSKKT
ncbi:hypothetical protein ONS96_008096 [Cadophora gregata f. sp. sojae]|nr:hypothetical protein ONS96_008096 [Cadophora gregata f. sp. sojae]